VPAHAAVRADGLGPLRWLDVILVVAAAPFVLLMGGPALGFLAGAAGWIVARVGGVWLEGAARRAADPRRAVALQFFTGLGRAWFVAVVILAVGLVGERQDGLTAALTVFFAFTAYLITGIALRPRRSQSHP
jgi:hypothetical protein